MPTHPHHHQQPPEESGSSAGAEAMVRTLRLAFWCLRVLMLVLFVCYCFSGWFTVPENEQNFVLRFGRLVGAPTGTIYQSGKLHMAWPRPVDHRVRVEVSKVRTVSTGNFWYQQTTNVLSAEPPPPSEKLVIGQDGYLLTGDYNILHARWSLTYTLADAIDFYVNYAKPDEVIQKVLENAVLKETARTPIEEALYRDREGLRQRVLQRVSAKLHELKIGLDAAQVQVYYTNQAPPGPTIGAFQGVINADQEKSTKINEAEKYANRVRQEASGKASRIMAEAESYRSRVVASTEADAKYLEDLLPQFEKAPQTMVLSLYALAVREVLGRAQSVYNMPRNQQIWLRLGPQAKSPNSPGNNQP